MTNNDNISAFDSHEYDEKIRKTLPYYDEFYKQITSIVKLMYPESLRWLDIGCGTGRMADEVFREKIALQEFVLLDNAEKMIEIVKHRYPDPNLDFINGSVLEMNQKEKFDVVTAVQVFHYLSDKERVIAMENCRKALHKHGILFYFENFCPYNQQNVPLFLQRWKEYQISQGKSEEEADKHVKRYGKDYFPITIDEHMKILDECGFSNCEIIWLSNMQVGIMAIK